MKQKLVSWYSSRTLTAPLLPDMPRNPVYDRISFSDVEESVGQTLHFAASTLRITAVNSVFTRTINVVPTS